MLKSFICALFGFTFLGGPVILWTIPTDAVFAALQIACVIGFFAGWRYLYKTMD